MAFSLTHHYTRAKSGLMNIDPKEATQLAEDWLIAGGTGLALGLMSAAFGGLDKKVMGMNVPIDGLAALALGGVGLATRSRELQIASIAAGGSASTRTFEAFFKKGMGVHGDFDSQDIPFGFGHQPAQLAGFGQQSQFAPGFGFGFGSEKDRLVEAAKAL